MVQEYLWSLFWKSAYYS